MSMRTSIHPPVRMGKAEKEIKLPIVDHGIDIIGDEWDEPEEDNEDKED